MDDCCTYLRLLLPPPLLLLFPHVPHLRLLLHLLSLPTPFHSGGCLEAKQDEEWCCLLVGVVFFAVCCSVLQCDAVEEFGRLFQVGLVSVVAFCSVLQCVAV